MYTEIYYFSIKQLYKLTQGHPIKLSLLPLYV